MNSMGIMMGGGIARELSKWIVDGAPDLDLFTYDCSRYHKDGINDDSWVKKRTHESYAKTYAIVFPHDEALAGRGLRKSGVYNDLLK